MVLVDAYGEGGRGGSLAPAIRVWGGSVPVLRAVPAPGRVARWRRSHQPPRTVLQTIVNGSQDHRRCTRRPSRMVPQSIDDTPQNHRRWFKRPFAMHPETIANGSKVDRRCTSRPSRIHLKRSCTETSLGGLGVGLRERDELAFFLGTGLLKEADDLGEDATKAGVSFALGLGLVVHLADELQRLRDF